MTGLAIRQNLADATCVNVRRAHLLRSGWASSACATFHGHNRRRLRIEMGHLSIEIYCEALVAHSDDYALALRRPREQNRRQTSAKPVSKTARFPIRSMANNRRIS